MKKKILPCPWKCPRVGLGAASEGLEFDGFLRFFPLKPAWDPVISSWNSFATKPLGKAVLPLGANLAVPAGNSPDP